MSLIHTLIKRVADQEAHFKAVLDQMALAIPRALRSSCSSPTTAVERRPAIVVMGAALRLASLDLPIRVCNRLRASHE